MSRPEISKDELIACHVVFPIGRVVLAFAFMVIFIVGVLLQGVFGIVSLFAAKRTGPYDHLG